jgi:3-oxoacyl-[acyl-carrier-protein] synthase II
MAEAAAVLVLEERERALARGATAYVEVIGYGLTNDAHHMTAPRPDGRQAARAMRMAFESAGVPAEEVGYINAHGSSTPLNDPTEAIAIRQLLGSRAERVPISGTKGYFGHALGASGAVEVAECAIASRRSWLPPAVNLVEADPACELNFVPGGGTAAQPEYLLSNSFGFGGINAALLLRATP